MLLYVWLLTGYGSIPVVLKHSNVQTIENEYEEYWLDLIVMKKSESYDESLGLIVK